MLRHAEMNYLSQAGQDRFVEKLQLEREGVPRGEFLDIGCGGYALSNTAYLEHEGWRGTLIDNSESAAAISAGRPSKFIYQDATQVDYSFLPKVVDYLSLDVDENSYEVLARLPLDKTRFRAMTIEHDAYRFSQKLREPMIQLLENYGYDILCADVCNPWPFEIWAVDPKRVDMKIAEKFRRNEPTPWREILDL